MVTPRVKVELPDVDPPPGAVKRGAAASSESTAKRTRRSGDRIGGTPDGRLCQICGEADCNRVPKVLDRRPTSVPNQPWTFCRVGFLGKF